MCIVIYRKLNFEFINWSHTSLWEFNIVHSFVMTKDHGSLHLNHKIHVTESEQRQLQDKGPMITTRSWYCYITQSLSDGDRLSSSNVKNCLALHSQVVCFNILLRSSLSVHVSAVCAHWGSPTLANDCLTSHTNTCKCGLPTGSSGPRTDTARAGDGWVVRLLI